MQDFSKPDSTKSHGRVHENATEHISQIIL